MCFKVEHVSIKRGIKLQGSKVKDYFMKEMKILTMNNSCFAEIEHAAITQETKDRALSLLMLMVLKINEYLKTRGVANESKQRPCIDKNDCSYPTLDSHAFKCTCRVIAKERIDTATVDLPDFSFRHIETERN